MRGIGSILGGVAAVSIAVACGGTDSNGIAGSGGSIASGGGKTDGAAATGGSSSGGASSGGGSGTGAAGNGGAGGASGASGAGGIEDAGLPDVVFNYDADVPQPEACAATTVKAETIPLDLYVVLDRSGSMVNPTLGNLRWPPVRDALNTFFSSPQAAGIGIALTMFAHPFKTACSAASYSTPLVPMAPLPGSATGQATTLQNTMNQYAPVLGVGTPTESAMKGAVQFAQTYKTANPSRTVAIVLATDGLPGDASCSGETAAGVQAAISAGFTGTPSIRTFVIGIDPTATMSANLNSWATAGGGQAFDVATSTGSSQFLQAMKDIQGKLLGCTFSMPTSDAGVIDLTKVKVVFTSSTGVSTELPRVNDKTACTGPGWYYDNNTNPTTIELCPASCTTVQSDQLGKIDIELGCLGS